MHYYMKKLDSKGRAIRYYYKRQRPLRPQKGYLIDCDDFSVEQEFETNKKRAIELAKDMAKSYNTHARVLPCIDFVVDEYKPYWVIAPSGEIIENF